MCQYNNRCRVHLHRPGTVCPLMGTGRGWGRPVAPRPVAPRPVAPRPRTTASRSGRPSRLGSSAGSGGFSLVDLLAIVVANKAWDRLHEAMGVWAVALVCLLLAAPFVLAAWLAARCTAWNGTVEGRCAKRRPRPFQRCEVDTHSHAAQPITAPEVAAVVCFLAGVASLWAFLAL